MQKALKKTKMTLPALHGQPFSENSAITPEPLVVQSWEGHFRIPRMFLHGFQYFSNLKKIVKVEKPKFVYFTVKTA